MTSHRGSGRAVAFCCVIFSLMLFYQAHETYTTGVVSHRSGSYITSDRVEHASGAAVFALFFLGCGWYVWWQDERCFLVRG